MDSPPRGFLDRALAWLVTALPFGLAVARAASSTQWRDDLPAVRDLGLVAVGMGGGVSTVATQALRLLPLGSQTFRAALGSAVALAVATRVLYALTRRSLIALRPSTRLAPVLAAIACSTAALAPTWQREATVGGGAMIAVALALGTVALARRAADGDDARSWIELGVVFGATFAESPPAALAAAVATVALFAALRFGPSARKMAPPRRALYVAALACVATIAVLVAPLILRPFAPGAWVDIGRALSAADLSSPDIVAGRTTALGAWTREVGLISLAIAGFGGAVAIARPRLRPAIAPFIALLVLDTLLPARAAGVLTVDALTPLRSLAVASIAAASALGVYEVTALLLALRVPMARSAAALLVVFHITLVALTSEEASFVADRSEQLAAEAWADDAFGRLPPRSAVLVRSPALAWRLLSSRLVRGERPDILVLPIPLLGRGRIASTVLSTERETEPLLRDFALTGEPSEFGLSKLADVRPLHVELDRAWSHRLASHLTADGLWLQYAPQPLGPSDRKLAAAKSAAPLRRVLEELLRSPVPDASTSSVVATSLRAQANVLGQLGDNDAAEQMLFDLGRVSAQDATITSMPTRYAITGIKRAVMRRIAHR